MFQNGLDLGARKCIFPCTTKSTELRNNVFSMSHFVNVILTVFVLKKRLVLTVLEIIFCAQKRLVLTFLRR